MRDWQSNQIERNWHSINQNKIGGSGIKNGNLQGSTNPCKAFSGKWTKSIKLHKIRDLSFIWEFTQERLLVNKNRNIAFCCFQNTGDFCNGSEQFVVERPAIQIIQRSPWNEPTIQKTNCSPKTPAIGCFSNELVFRIVPNKMFQSPIFETPSTQTRTSSSFFDIINRIKEFYTINH